VPSRGDEVLVIDVDSADGQVGERVRARRLELQERDGIRVWSHRAVGAKAGVDPSWLVKFEKGEYPGTRVESRDKIVRVAQVLGLDPVPLLVELGHMVGPADGSAPPLEDAVERDPRLTREQKDTILGLVRLWTGEIG
jgi:transcriptional regulator with XRE-family HTH domain